MIFSDNNEEQKLTVEAIDNHVYFYSDVNPDRCLAMIRAIKEIDIELRNEAITRDTENNTPIWLHINSNGGDLFTGLATADQLLRIKTPICSIVEGIGASAATLLSLACTKRFITQSSVMLIHQLSAIHWGTHEQFKDEMKLQEIGMDILIKFYHRQTKMNRKQIQKFLQRDTWLNSKECLKYGLVDGIR